MLGLYVTVPIASFRRGSAREFWESYPVPPPATVYGFLLSFVGEVDRERHGGVRCTAGLLRSPDRGKVLRRLWRIKDRKLGMGNGANVRPDYQELLLDVRLVVWVDSSEESGEGASLEQRLGVVLDPAKRGGIKRFGGLSLGESTHLVDEVLPLDRAPEGESAKVFLTEPTGNLSLPVWVDHVGSAGTRNVLGRLKEIGFEPPPREQLPRIPVPDVK